jgi:hypothetical protein
MEYCNNINPSTDWSFFEEISMDCQTVGDQSMQYETQFNGLNQNYTTCTFPLMDSINQPSTPYQHGELHYQAIPSPDCSFGSAQLAPYMPHPQVTSSIDFDPPSVKKPVNKRRNSTPPGPPLDRQYINLNDWHLTDENGRKRRPLLHEFVRILLENENYSHIAGYVDKRKGIFKFYEREEVAALWGLVKGRNGTSSKFYFICKLLKLFSFVF